MLPTLKHFGVGSVPWSLLARGKLTRPNTWSAEESRTTREQTDKFIALLSTTAETKVVGRVEEVAKKKDVSMAQVVLAWMMSKEGRAPIVGTTSEKKLQDLVGAVHVELSEEEIKYLEELYQTQPTVGHA